MVMTWWREVLYRGHFKLAPEYQAETYIQHNPNVNTGRAGFIDFFTKLGRKPMDPISESDARGPAAGGLGRQGRLWSG